MSAADPERNPTPPKIRRRWRLIWKLTGHQTTSGLPTLTLSSLIISSLNSGHRRPSPVVQPGAHSPDSWGGHGSGDAGNGVYSPQKASTESFRGSGVANEAVGGETPPAHREDRALPGREAQDFSVVRPGAQAGRGDSPPPPPSPPPGSPPGN